MAVTIHDVARLAGVNSSMILPMIFAKLACGFSALFVANLLSPQLLAKAESAVVPED